MSDGPLGVDRVLSLGLAAAELERHDAALLELLEEELLPSSFARQTRRMDYTESTLPDGSIVFTPVVPPPGPFKFLAPPGGPWVAKLQQDLTAPGAALGEEFTYGGRPGGTTGCEWLAAQLSVVAGQGARIETKWDGTQWVSAGFGTSAKFAFPSRVRFYDLVESANIVGHNKLSPIGWCDPWIEEIDGDEAAVAAVGSWGVSWARVHNGSAANVTAPMSYKTPQALGVVTCNEVELDVIGGVPTFTIRRAGVVVGSTPIPAADWATMLANPHWWGTQDELYAVGVAPASAVDVRYVLGLEIFGQ